MGKGLRVGVLRDAGLGDCTNGGVTGKHNRVTLFVPGRLDGYIDPAEAQNALVAINRPEFGWYAVPAEWVKVVNGKPVVTPPAGSVGPMFGGNFIYTSDSRFREAVGWQPIPVHDRVETPEQYRALSI